MRGRLPAAKFDQRSAVIIFEEFLRVVNSNSEDLLNKTECLKNLLNQIKFTFSKSNKKELAKQLDADIKKLFEDELINKCRPISISLVTCLIQCGSSAIQILALRIIIYLTHLNEFHKQFESLNVADYIVRIIDLDQGYIFV